MLMQNDTQTETIIVSMLMWIALSQKKKKKLRFVR